MKPLLPFLMGAITATALLFSLKPQAGAAEGEGAAPAAPARTQHPGVALVLQFTTIAPNVSEYSKERGDRIWLMGDLMQISNPKDGTHYVPLSNVASFRLIGDKQAGQ